ncbi:carbohydrate binding domain-containing protein [Microbulbifer agarilyticus]|uniref:carbohydrate binding domain-containing protein n=1 Tax=Microbulbifer agarilyticus TaxID=260552 RepID=UPI001CD27609|nr:carbohydrate binding domain-containing protein [Microbulbifer agarilyticus]MCA0892161.1 carbohydrate binding domain-containing protein [Microbulbifer agarilyticus]
MQKYIPALMASLLATPLSANAAIDITIQGNAPQHTVHPMIQGQGLVYSEEADLIYADGSMAQLFKDVGAGFLRWPGGTVTTMYHWNNLSGVGWVDNWDPGYNPDNNAAPTEYMDLDEYMALTAAAGTEPMLGINMSSGIEWDREEEALQEATDMIAYCLSNSFDVKYFYLDNETYHHGNGYNKDRDGDGEAWTPETYAQQINIYAAAIKALVPDAILIANWTDKVRTNTGAYTTLINVAGDNIDYIDVHWYWKWGTSNWDAWKAKTPMENETEWYDGGTFVEEMGYFNDLTASLGKPHIKLAALEWNIAPGDHNTNPDHTPFMTALMASEMQMQFIQGGLELGAMWTTQWEGSSQAEFQFLVNSDDGYNPAPMAKVFELYKHAIGGQVVSSSASDGKVLSAAVVNGDKAYVYLLSKKDAQDNAEIILNGYDVLSVENAYRFADPGVISNIGLWQNTTGGNYFATLKPNTLTMIELNVERDSTPIPNLLTNGDFESDLTGWALWNQPVITTDAASGSKAVKMVDKGSLNQTVSVQPNTTYIASAQLKSSSAAERIVLGVNDGAGNGIASTESYDANYTRKHIIFTTDAGASSVSVYAWQPPSNNTTAYVDDIRLKEYVVHIENGGFEDGLNEWNTWNPVSVTSTEAYSGSQALQLNGNASANQFIPVEPNTRYAITGYAKVEDPHNSKVVLGVKKAADNSVLDKLEIYDSSYTQQQLTFTTDAETNEIKLYFWRPKAGVDASHLDSLSIVELP